MFWILRRTATSSVLNGTKKIRSCSICGSCMAVGQDSLERPRLPRTRFLSRNLHPVPWFGLHPEAQNRVKQCKNSPFNPSIIHSENASSMQWSDMAHAELMNKIHITTPLHTMSFGGLSRIEWCQTVSRMFIRLRFFFLVILFWWFLMVFNGF